MSIYLPKSGNIPQSFSQEWYPLDETTTLAYGFVKNRVLDSIVNKGGAHDINTAHIRFGDNTQSFSVPTTNSVFVGVELASPLAGRSLAPLQVGLSGHMHMQTPVQGLLTCFGVFMSQYLGAGDQLWWQVEAYVPFTMNTETLDSSSRIFHYYTDHVMTNSHFPTDIQEHQLFTGKVGWFMCFFNKSGATVTPDIVFADLYMVNGYRNRPVFDSDGQ